MLFCKYLIKLFFSKKKLKLLKYYCDKNFNKFSSRSIVIRNCHKQYTR